MRTCFKVRLTAQQKEIKETATGDLRCQQIAEEEKVTVNPEQRYHTHTDTLWSCVLGSAHSVLPVDSVRLIKKLLTRYIISKLKVTQTQILKAYVMTLNRAGSVCTSHTAALAVCLQSAVTIFFRNMDSQ